MNMKFRVFVDGSLSIKTASGESMVLVFDPVKRWRLKFWIGKKYSLGRDILLPTCRMFTDMF